MNKNKGFTLIELLVVIAIIGILSSVVLASLSNARNKGKDAAVKSQLASMKAQAELYYAKSETYHVDATDNVCLSTQANNGFGGTSGPGLFKAAYDSSGLATGIEVNPASGSGTDLLTARCNSLADSWAVVVPLSDSGKLYCADNTGMSKEVTTNIATGITVCP